MNRPLVTSLLFAGVSIGGSGCFPFTTTTVRTWRVDQAATVVAPSGPHMLGSLVPHRRVAVEAAISMTQVQPSTQSRGEGEIGNVVFNGVGRGRIAYGWRNVLEFGMDVGYASGAWATPIATDSPVQTQRPGDVFQFGTGVRGIVLGSKYLSWGAGLEVGAVGMPWVRTTNLTTVSTSSYPGGYGSTFPGGTTTTSSSAASSTDGGYLVAFQGRVSTFLLASPTRGLTFQVGALAQLVPVFGGHLQYMDTCVTSYPPYSSGCSGTTPPAGPAWAMSAVATAFGSASFDVGPFTFIAGIYAHFAGQPEITRTTPSGGDLAVRVAF
jgi:hypothetical protein